MIQSTEWGPGRREWMDVLRGLAVIMVVVTHTIRLVQYYDEPVPVFPMIVDILTPLRMPMLFLLSGMLVPRSLVKGTWVYLRGKLSKVLYPYVLWTIILAMLTALAAGPFVFPDLFRLLFVESATPLWFLGYLVLYYLIALLCRWVHPLVIVVAAMGLALIHVPGEWERFWYHAVSFFIGVALGPFISSFERFLGNRLLAWVFFVSGGGAMTFQYFYGQGSGDLLWKLVVSMLFFIGAAGIVKPIAKARGLGPIRYVGQRTIKIYILHWPFIEYPLRWLTTNFDVPLRFLIPIILFCGLVPPLLITILADRYRAVEWFFEWKPPARAPHNNSVPESKVPV